MAKSKLYWEKEKKRGEKEGKKREREKKGRKKNEKKKEEKEKEKERRKKGGGGRKQIKKQNKTKTKTKGTTGEYLLILCTLSPLASPGSCPSSWSSGGGPVVLIFRCQQLGELLCPCLVQGSVGVVYPVRPQEEQPQWRGSSGNLDSAPAGTPSAGPGGSGRGRCSAQLGQERPCCPGPSRPLPVPGEAGSWAVSRRPVLLRCWIRARRTAPSAEPQPEPPELLRVPPCALQPLGSSAQRILKRWKEARPRKRRICEYARICCIDGVYSIYHLQRYFKIN